MTEKLEVNHGTTTIGIQCKDGIVLASDKRSSLGSMMIGDSDVQKIYPLTDSIAVTIAGTVSDAQLILKLLKAEMKLKVIRTRKEIAVKEAANLLASMLYENIRRPTMIQGAVAMLMAGKDSEGFHFYNLGMDGSILKKKDYYSEGSGMIFALPILDAEYKEGITVEQGITLAFKAINAALQRDFHTGGGVDIYTITNKGVEKVAAKKVPIRIE